jgi:hypothetical protein
MEENSKPAPFDEPNPKGMRHPGVSQRAMGSPPAGGNDECGVHQLEPGPSFPDLPRQNFLIQRCYTSLGPSSDGRIVSSATNYSVEGADTVIQSKGVSGFIVRATRPSSRRL